MLNIFFFLFFFISLSFNTIFQGKGSGDDPDNDTLSKASLLNHLNTIVKQRLEEDIHSVDLDHNDQMPTLEIDELWEALTKMYRTKNDISWETMFVATFQGKSSDFESKNMTSRDIKELKKDAISKFYKKKRGKKKIIELSVFWISVL